MIKRFAAAPVLAICLALSPAAKADDHSANTVIATVNGVEITLGHMIAARATLPQQYQQLPDNVLFDGILDQLVQQEALAQSFKGDLPARVTMSLENETRSLTAGEAVEGILEEAMTEEAIAEAYRAKYVDQEPGKEYNASHILVETEETATGLVEELAAGGDFAALAKEKSTGPSGPNGGSLGWFSDGMMVPAFEEAVKGLEVGQVSTPVQTQFGWHVIILNDVRAKDVPELDQVRAEIEADVREKALTAAIQALVSEAEVDRSGADGVDPTVLRELGMLE